MAESELYIGVMSGTSLDGVDTALVALQGDHITLLAHHDYPMPASLKQRLLSICIGQPTTLITMGELEHDLGHLFSEAVLALLEHSGYHSTQIRAIGCHGQTVFHQPTGAKPFTLQIGDANIIATRTGITTVADFRRKDIALGGQGAPLVPAFHRTIFHAAQSTVVVLNIGGIANISVLKPNGEVIGYDTGPGNMLMDSWILQQHNQAYDQDAKWAKRGQTNHALLTQLKQDHYFALSAPKSTGRERFNLPWLQAELSKFSMQSANTVNATDVQRTLCEFTAQTIAEQVNLFAAGIQPQLLVCGGGAQNPLLMERLQALLPNWQVAPTTQMGVDGDNMEAMAFAWLAQRRIHNLPSNLPSVTGASRHASLGVIYYPD
ncbi:MAG: anhydro-N-acetylmuramic acid kinase [Vibrio sp.]